MRQLSPKFCYSCSWATAHLISSSVNSQILLLVYIFTYIYIFGYDLLCGWKNTLHSSNITNIFKCGWFEAFARWVCFLVRFDLEFVGWFISLLREFFFSLYCGAIAERAWFQSNSIYISKSLCFQTQLDAHFIIMQCPLFSQIVLSIFFSFGFWHKPNCFKFAKKKNRLHFLFFSIYTKNLARNVLDSQVMQEPI